MVNGVNGGERERQGAIKTLKVLTTRPRADGLIEASPRSTTGSLLGILDMPRYRVSDI